METFARAFEAEGYSVWWNPDIRPGETWDEVIGRELRAAVHVVRGLMRPSSPYPTASVSHASTSRGCTSGGCTG